MIQTFTHVHAYAHPPANCRLNNEILVDRTNWLGSSTTSKGSEQAALFYVEQIVTVHIVLFYV